MVALRLSAFSGAVPIRDLRLLPDEAAAKAVNVSTDGGSLVGINEPTLIKSLASTTKHVYKLPYHNTTNVELPPTNMLDAHWLEFDDMHTDVLRTPNINDSFERYYWASPSTGFKYATLTKLLNFGPSSGIDVGIEVPPTALIVSAIGGTADAPTITRAYYQTFVSIYGEEGQPGPSYEATGKSDANWAISSIDQPVNGPSSTTIDRIRIYRTITSASGVTTFFFVTELSVGTTAYVDTLSDAIVSANKQSDSVLWAPPPDGLEGIVAMPNGIFVGWKDNTLYFSENFRPHAWPAEYAITVQFPIVGLGVYGQTCVVCTTGNPATVTGVRSSVMALSQSKVSAPCLSRRGIVSFMGGVYYPSTDGLVLVSQDGASIVTETVISKNQWNQDFKPSDLKSFYSRGAYGAIRGSDGFLLTLNGVINTEAYTDPVNVSIDEWSNNVWLIDDDKLYHWHNIDADRLEFSWKSKEFVLPRKLNMSVAQVYYDLLTPPGNEEVRVRVWADRELVFDQDITHVGSGGEFRLPSGFKRDVWQFEIVGNTKVHNLNVATSSAELRNV